MVSMKLLQVKVDDNLMIALKIEAAKRQTNVSEIVRDNLSAVLGLPAVIQAAGEGK